MSRDRDRLAKSAEAVPVLFSIQSPTYFPYRRATEVYARDLIRGGATAEEVDKILAAMWAVECAHDMDCGRRVTHTEWRGGYPRLADTEPVR